MEDARTDTLETVEGTVSSVVFRNPDNGYTVLHVEPPRRGVLAGREKITVVGKTQAAWEGEEIHAQGRWVLDKVHGRQFKADKITCDAPRSVVGVERYLASGLIKGVGKVLAKRIVDTFGEDTLDVLSHHSERLREVPKLGRSKIAQIKASWHANDTLRETMVFGQTYGISIAKMTKIVRKYGPDTVAIIKGDPYQLCRDIWGIGFLTADKIALSVGIPKDSPVRARAVVSYALEVEADGGGHCWSLENDILLKGNELCSIPVETLGAALEEEISKRRIVAEPVDPDNPAAGRRIYSRSLYICERSVAGEVRRILLSPPSFRQIDAGKAVDWWESKSGFSLAVGQASALRRTLSAKFSVIAGGPGVGKTTIIRALADIYRARRLKVVLAAPTGRAAKRMTESVGIDAQTIHRMLKWNPATNKFTFDRENRLEGDVFIFDETSMIDIRLAASLLAAIPSGATVVFVGDTDQLPSVGPGNVLRDLIKSGVVAYSRLDTIFRQDSSGLIVLNAHHINAGEPIETRGGDTDFYFVRCEDAAVCVSRIVDLMVRRIPSKFGFDPLADIQVLTPMRRNLLGTENLNAELQKAVNPRGDAVMRGGMCLRAGDRVMQLRNNYDKDVYNGDIGFVKSVSCAEKKIAVDFDGRPVVYDQGELDEITLAYATTVHKSQGSEYPAVIVVLHSQHYVMLQRNLLYTAITRGRKLVILIGVPYAVDQAIKNNDVGERRTSLAERCALPLQAHGGDGDAILGLDAAASEGLSDER